MSVKEDLLCAAEQLLLQKMKDIQHELEELDIALQNETKSSAGDKYETSREMISQEQQKLRELQTNTKRMLDLLKNGNSTSEEKVRSGHLVQTDKALLYISAPIGKVDSKGKSAFFISPSSPLAQALLGKLVGDTASFNGVTHKILEIS